MSPSCDCEQHMKNKSLFFFFLTSLTLGLLSFAAAVADLAGAVGAEEDYRNVHTLNPVPCMFAGAALRPGRCWPASPSPPPCSLPALPGAGLKPGSTSCSQSCRSLAAVCPGTHTKRGTWRKGGREGSFPQLLFLQPFQGMAAAQGSSCCPVKQLQLSEEQLAARTAGGRCCCLLASCKGSQPELTHGRCFPVLPSSRLCPGLLL